VAFRPANTCSSLAESFFRLANTCSTLAESSFSLANAACFVSCAGCLFLPSWALFCSLEVFLSALSSSPDGLGVFLSLVSISYERKADYLTFLAGMLKFIDSRAVS
jgi:hypothetical protein